eukprot:TRINITY_DN199_c0_g1_i1.p1 TRINITY_DN199_c0_g1~~TRINITY_DN199_c0_g1_i1.p1  ORF type:complete len:381 (-),score=63.98 TRINITY_DN199_c0_g1_i1:215-1357(-)
MCIRDRYQRRVRDRRRRAMSSEADEVGGTGPQEEETLPPRTDVQETQEITDEDPEGDESDPSTPLVKDYSLDKHDPFVRQNAAKGGAKEDDVMYMWALVLCLFMLLHITVCMLVMAHYEGWDIWTGLYFALVTITTVGYGQFVPTNAGTKIYTTFFILIGLGISGVFIAIIQMKVLDSMIVRSHRAVSKWTALTIPSILTVLWLLAYCAVIVGMGDFTWLDAWYFAVISFTTVGYGDLTLAGQDSRLVGIFFLMSGTALFAFLLSTIVTLATTEYRMRACHAFFSRPLTKARLMEMDTDNSGDVSRAEFMEYMLLASNTVDPDVLVEINSCFDRAAVGPLGDMTTVSMAPRAVLNLNHVQTEYKPANKTETDDYTKKETV